MAPSSLQRLSLWLALVVALLGGCAQPAPTSSTVGFELALPPEAVGSSAEVEVLWLGQTRRVPLDALTGSSTILRGEVSGPPLRILPMTLRLRSPTGEELEGFHSLEVLTGADEVLHFALDRQQPQPIRRLSSARLPAQVERHEQLWVLASLLWGALLLAAARWMSRRRRRSSGSLPAPPPVPWEGLGWLLLAIAWTWPAVRAGDAWLVGRNFDALGTVWTLDALPRLGVELTDRLTRWPDGADYASLDSYTLAPLAWLLQWMSPVRLHGLLQVVGVASSAWATSAFARAVGARAPWTFLAGLGFAFSGMAANVLLEGHVYHLLAPWLPLFGWAWWRATGPEGRPVHGLLAGLCFVLTLLTTGYLGVAAALIAVAFFVGGLAREGLAVVRPGLAALAVVLPVGLLYVGQMGSSGLTEGYTTEAALRLGAASLRTLAGPSPELDRFDHSLALAVPGVVLALVLVAGRVLPSRTRWLPLALTGAAALFVALGPVLALRASAEGLPSPIGWLWSLPGASLLRFPARLSWAWFLCASVLAALVATHLARHRETVARWLLVAALVDAFVVVGLPWRQQTRLATVPSAYSQVEGPLLELLPEGQNPNGELDNWFNATTCLYQTVHQQPISDDCVLVPIEENPRWVRSRWVVARLLSGEVEAVHARMVEEGFAGLVLHPDLLFPGDRSRLQAALTALDPTPVTSTDGGEHIHIYRLGGASPAPSLPSAVGTAEGLDLELVGPSSPRVGYSLRWAAAGQATLTESLGPDRPSHSGDVHRPSVADREPPAAVPAAVPPELAATTSILWRHELREALPRQGRLTLLAAVDGVSYTVWEGPLQLVDGVDRLSFRLTSPTTAEPALVAPEAFSPPAHETTSIAVLLGWLSMGLALLVGWRRR